jgi:hypothetical protein
MGGKKQKQFAAKNPKNAEKNTPGVLRLGWVLKL